MNSTSDNLQDCPFGCLVEGSMYCTIVNDVCENKDYCPWLKSIDSKEINK